MSHRTLVRAVMIAVATLGTVTACDNGDVVSSAHVAALPTSTSEEPATTTPPATTTQAPVTPVQPAPATVDGTAEATATTVTLPPATGERLTVVTDPKLGKVVTEHNGMTLYRLDSDTTRPPQSNCLGKCTQQWVPLTAPADGTVAVVGVDPALVGTVARADRITQLTIAGRPLYRFAGDTAPGDTKGQGAGGVAFAVSPNGGKAVATVS